MSTLVRISERKSQGNWWLMDTILKGIYLDAAPQGSICPFLEYTSWRVIDETYVKALKEDAARVEVGGVSLLSCLEFKDYRQSREGFRP